MRLRFSKSVATLLGTACIAVIFGCKWLYHLARTPLEPKPCLFVFPEASDKPTTVSISWPEWLQSRGGFINDASCLNHTPIYGVALIQSEEDVKKALQFARDNDLSITSAGQRHSMGGQSFKRNGLVLDMRALNAITIDAQNKVATVQSGATWEQVQRTIDPLGLSVKAMQSINIFTIGGTLSVNAHGIAHHPGSVASTVRSVRVMRSDGTIVTASATENTDLFHHVIGGYGLFGVILEAEFDLVDNEIYAWDTQYLSYTDFPAYFKNHIQQNPDIGLFFARLSVSPYSYLSETAVHTFTRTTSVDPLPLLQTVEPAWVQRLVFNLSKTGSTGRWVRWFLEKNAVKKLAPCVTRNNAMRDSQECLLARNHAMFDSMPYLKNGLRDTDILQEYFVPLDALPSFVDRLKEIVGKNNVNLLNATIRYVEKDTITALPYAKEDMFGMVLYFNQKLTKEDSEKLQIATRELVDAAIQQKGTFYLPYQLYYSREQLRLAYPEIDAFYTMKNNIDPDELFTNTWFEKYK